MDVIHSAFNNVVFPQTKVCTQEKKISPIDRVKRNAII